MLTFHPRPLLAKKPGGIALAFGDSLSDLQVSVSGSEQGIYVSTLCTRHGWTRVGLGQAPTNAVLGTPVASGGHVTSVPVTTSGFAYPTPPAVTITGGTFSVQATAVAVLGVDGSVAGITITNSGTYTVNPTGATIAASPNTKAILVATIAGGAVTGFTVTQGGTGFPSFGSSLFFTATGGDTITDAAWAGATNTSGGAITSWLAGSSHGGAGYLHVPTLAVGNTNNHARPAIASTTLVHSGALVDCGIDTYALRCTNANADVVLIWYGTNDYTQCSVDAVNSFATFNPTSFKAALSTVAAAVRAQASNPLLVLLGIGPNQAFYTATTYPTGLDGQPLTSAVAVLAEFNRAIAEVAAQYGGVYVSTQTLNYAAHGAGTSGAAAPHLNATGAQYVADLVSAALG